MTYCLHSPHTVTSSLTLVVLSVDSVDSTAGCSQKQLMIFFFSFSFLRFIFFGWSYRPFVLGQSVPPPPHLPGGFPEKPAAELGVRRCHHSKPSARVQALQPPPPAGLELASLAFPPAPIVPPPASRPSPSRPLPFSPQSPRACSFWLSPPPVTKDLTTQSPAPQNTARHGHRSD